MPLVSKSFSDIITFSRGSNATYFDSAGVLKYAPNNAIRNNTMVGAVAGTPGTLPSISGSPVWSVGGLGTLTQEIVGTSTSNGITYIDIRFSGTTSTTQLTVRFETLGAIGAANGQSWAISAWLAIVGGSASNTSNYTLGNNLFDSGSAYIGEGPSVTLSSAPTSTFTRYSGAGTISVAGTAYMRPYVYFLFASGVAIDITLRIGLPQLEIGNTAGPAIPTSGTAYYGPRFDYNPTTLAAQGLLIEEARTNLVTYSEAFDDASWLATRLNTTGTPAWVDVAVAPDGATTADKFIPNTDNNTHTINKSPTLTANTAYAWSVFAKAAEYENIRIRFGKTSSPFTRIGVIVNLLTGAVTNSDVGTPTSVTQRSAVPVGNGWYKITVAGIFDTTSTDGFVSIESVDNAGATTFAGDGTKGIYIWGAQLEAGAFPTSYIPTTTTALTRAADVASVNTLSPWFNASEGTLYGEYSVYTSAGAKAIAQISDGTFSNRIQFFANTGDPYSVASRLASGGITTSPSNTGSVAVGTVGKVALAYAIGANQGGISVNGSAVNTSSPASAFNSVTALELGKGASISQLNGWLRRVSFYPRRLSNEELQAITS